MIILPLKINGFTLLIFIKWESVPLFSLSQSLIHERTLPLPLGLCNFFLNIFTYGTLSKTSCKLKKKKKKVC